MEDSSYWFHDGKDPQFAFDIIRLPKLIYSQVVAIYTGDCYLLNRHQALIDNAFREQIRKHISTCRGSYDHSTKTRQGDFLLR